MSETNGNKKNAKQTRNYVKTFRDGAVAANVFARRAPGGFEYLDFSLSRAWKTSNDKEGYSQSFFANNCEALHAVIDQACEFVDQHNAAGCDTEESTLAGAPNGIPGASQNSLSNPSLRDSRCATPPASQEVRIRSASGPLSDKPK
jgi:hypothetical protein